MFVHPVLSLIPHVQAVTGKSREEIVAEVSRMSWGQFKPLLTDAVVAHLVSWVIV
jgi:tryptophanyl-tRNA synthetase